MMWPDGNRLLLCPEEDASTRAGELTIHCSQRGMEDGRWKMEIPDFRFQNPAVKEICSRGGVSFGARMIISKN